MDKPQINDTIMSSEDKIHDAASLKKSVGKEFSKLNTSNISEISTDLHVEKIPISREVTEPRLSCLHDAVRKNLNSPPRNNVKNDCKSNYTEKNKSNLFHQSEHGHLLSNGSLPSIVTNDGQTTEKNIYV